MKRYCLAVDLVDAPNLIAGYDAHHKAVWPEVIESIKYAGIMQMEIYRVANRLFMIMEVNDGFNFAEKALADINNEIVQQWERLMWKYQQPLPIAKPGEKWVLMDQIFKLG